MSLDHETFSIKQDNKKLRDFLKQKDKMIEELEEQRNALLKVITIILFDEE